MAGDEIEHCTDGVNWFQGRVLKEVNEKEGEKGWWTVQFIDGEVRDVQLKYGDRWHHIGDLDAAERGCPKPDFKGTSAMSFWQIPNLKDISAIAGWRSVVLPPLFDEAKLGPSIWLSE